MRLPPLAAEVLAGYVAGSAKTLAFYPLDTLTTLREIGARPEARPLSRYYAGCGLTLLGAAPYAVIFHVALWSCERLLRDALIPSVYMRLLASTAAAIAAAIVGVPFECLKHRVQLGVSGYKTPRTALLATLRTSGVRGLYTGLGSTIARNVPYNALHFGFFDLFAGVLRATALPVGARDLMAGAVAGALTALLTTPLDVVNTQLQTQAISGPLLGINRSTGFAGPVDALTTLVDEGGPLVLMRGAGVRVAQYAPSALIFFVVYEAIKRRLLP